MANEKVSKIIYYGQTLIDLTGDTVTADKLAQGVTAHAANGEIITGTNTYDSDTSDATATVSEVLASKTFYARGSKLTGTMVDNGSVTGYISTKSQEYTIPVGYHDGSGKVSISSTEQDKIIASNIREGITILGVTGTMSGEEGVTAEEVTMTPTNSVQVRTPSTGYNYISQVTVNAVPYQEQLNAAGGKTVTIGA